MKKTIAITAASLAVVGLTTLSVASVDAHGRGKMGGERGGQYQGEGRGMGPGAGLVPDELRDQWREEYQNMTDEQRAALREERDANREEHQAEMEEFWGLNRDEMRERHRSGETMSDLIQEQGKTQDQVREHLTEQANERVDMMAEHHDLSAEQTQSIRDRVATFVDSMMNRWFGN